MPYTSTSSQHSQHWSFAMQSQHYLCVLVPFSPRYSFLMRSPSSTCPHPRGESCCYGYYANCSDRVRGRSVKATRGVPLTQMAVLELSPAQLALLPLSLATVACLSSFVCAKNILVWCWFESTLQMCAKFAIMIFLTVQKKIQLYGCYFLTGSSICEHK